MDFAAFSDANVTSVIDEMGRTDPTKVVDGLSDRQLDICMKYIYKGMESGDNSNSMLKWHELVFAKGGLGCIIRAMTEREKKE